MCTFNDCCFDLASVFGCVLCWLWFCRFACRLCGFVGCYVGVSFSMMFGVCVLLQRFGFVLLEFGAAVDLRFWCFVCFYFFTIVCGCACLDLLD